MGVTKLVLVTWMLLMQISSIVGVSKMEFVTGSIGRSVSDPPTPGPMSSLDWSSHGTTTHMSRVSRHHPSMAAGGDVILGGFAFALVAAIVCYIRVTRKSNLNASMSS